MKRVFAWLLAAIGVNASAQAPGTATPAVISDLRSRALAVKPADIGLVASDYSDRPWGVLMETGFENGGAYSLIVLADGSTSVYFSTGGGIIGAGEHPEVKVAGRAMLQTAASLQTHAQPAVEAPLPSAGNVNFYFLTAKGTLKYSAPDSQLRTDKDPMYNLFVAGHKVIAAVRGVEQARGKAGN